MNDYLQRGWHDRQLKAQARRNDEKAEIDRIRREHFAELDRQAQIAAEAERAARKAKRVSCVVCDGGGTLTVEQAELVVRALQLLPADSQIDSETMQILVALASGEPMHTRHGLHLARGLAYPRRVATAPAAEITAPAGKAGVTTAPAPAKAAPARKARPTVPAPDWLDPDAVLEDDA